MVRYATNRNALPSINSRFTQQELPACKPILTPGWVISSFIFVGIIFIPIGLASLFASERVVEIVHAMTRTVFLQVTAMTCLHIFKAMKLIRPVPGHFLFQSK
ncbi:unnamed protein product, partial [Vitis vinifera]